MLAKRDHTIKIQKYLIIRFCPDFTRKIKVKIYNVRPTSNYVIEHKMFSPGAAALVT